MLEIQIDDLKLIPCRKADWSKIIIIKKNMKEIDLSNKQDIRFRDITAFFVLKKDEIKFLENYNNEKVFFYGQKYRIKKNFIIPIPDSLGNYSVRLTLYNEF